MFLMNIFREFLWVFLRLVRIGNRSGEEKLLQICTTCCTDLTLTLRVSPHQTPIENVNNNNICFDLTFVLYF